MIAFFDAVKSTYIGGLPATAIQNDLGNDCIKVATYSSLSTRAIKIKEDYPKSANACDTVHTTITNRIRSICQKFRSDPNSGQKLAELKEKIETLKNRRGKVVGKLGLASDVDKEYQGLNAELDKLPSLEDIETFIEEATGRMRTRCAVCC